VIASAYRMGQMRWANGLMVAGADFQLAIPGTRAPDGLHTNRSPVSRPAPLKARLYFGCLEHMDGGELHPSASACAFTINHGRCCLPT